MRQRVVSRDEWTTARVALLAHEKELTRLRDAISRQRRELPGVRIDKGYVYERPYHTQTLGDLFESRSQLLVYRFMFDPGWSDSDLPSTMAWVRHHDKYDGRSAVGQVDATSG
jgi:predicted dithiol-disulfide oxidoreductase (DUF899 family)